MLLDIEYQGVVTEKFKVHGFPAFIFCEQGKRKASFVAVSEAGMLLEVVSKNMSDTSI